MELNTHSLSSSFLLGLQGHDLSTKQEDVYNHEEVVHETVHSSSQSNIQERTQSYEESLLENAIKHISSKLNVPELTSAGVLLYLTEMQYPNFRYLEVRNIILILKNFEKIDPQDSNIQAIKDMVCRLLVSRWSMDFRKLPFTQWATLDVAFRTWNEQYPLNITYISESNFVIDKIYCFNNPDGHSMMDYTQPQSSDEVTFTYFCHQGNLPQPIVSSDFTDRHGFQNDIYYVDCHD